MRPITREAASAMIRRARTTARRARALSGRGELRAGYTDLFIRRTNGLMCRSQVILMRDATGDDSWTDDEPLGPMPGAWG